MQNRNNFLVAFAFILFVFVALIPTEWFSIASLGIANNGFSGSLGFPNTPKIPIWMLLSVSSASVAVAVLNLLQITTIPRFVPALGLVICGAYYALPLSVAEDHFVVKLSAAPYIAIAATLAAIGMLFSPLIRQSNRRLETEVGEVASSGQRI